MHKVHPIFFVVLAYYPVRVGGFVAHLIILVYELAAKPWDNVCSSLMIVTALFLIACLAIAIAVLIILRSDAHMTELGNARIYFLASLAQATGMVGLFIAWVLVMKHRPISLLVIHPFNM
ncbi:hypothetical protein LIA77_00666 [Sarocladium implicatum]|nr:hypothetical protein LIA77_00666 [Sarocladium implicatum]